MLFESLNSTRLPAGRDSVAGARTSREGSAARLRNAEPSSGRCQTDADRGSRRGRSRLRALENRSGRRSRSTASPPCRGRTRRMSSQSPRNRTRHLRFPSPAGWIWPLGPAQRYCAIDFTRPMQRWKSAWTRARRMARVNARWQDLRHTRVSCLAENPAISEETIRALAGHAGHQMLSPDAHIRAQASVLSYKYVE